MVLILTLWLGCETPEECAGNIEVLCDAEGCFCGDGEFTGEDCEDIPNSTDGESCEMKCCGTPESGGPASVLQGTP
jgi:hypothetical protein